MEAFDLQDTLVHINYSAAFGRISLVEEISKAKVIYRPQGQFAIITAQQEDAEIHKAITMMIHSKFPNCQSIHFVHGGTEAVAIAKEKIVTRNGYTAFTDNNTDILAKMKELKPDLKLWHMTKDGRKPF